MAKVTKNYVMLPWQKGLDTDTDEAILQFMKKADYIVTADDIVFAVDGSKVKRDGFTYHDSAAITGANDIIAGFDYWANVSSVKSQKIVVWDDQATSKCWFIAGSGGAWTELTKDASATAPTALKRVCYEVFNDDLIMAVTDSNVAGRAPLKWDNQSGTAYLPLGGTPPNIKYVRKHQGRVWAAGDPARPDRLYFTSPGNAEEWNGQGDSGAIDIDPGDGDSSGITAIFPSFRGALFVTKQNAIYRITGTSPIDYKVEMVTSGLGCISHNSSVAVDMDDIYFQSERGFHSLVLTQKYGDFEGAFLSSSVQNEFLQLDVLHKPFTQGVWIPSLNSVVWNGSVEATRMDILWLYDVRFKAWYKWTGVNPTALFRVEDSTTKYKRAYFGDNSGRLSKSQNIGVYHDYTSTVIDQRIKTPFIAADNNPRTEKAHKKLGVWIKMPFGESLYASVRLSGVNTTQELEFQSTSSGTPKLDVDFILGESELDAGGVLRMTPYTLPIEGVGSSIQIEFYNDDVDSYCAIFGFWIEYEDAGDRQETVGY
jgi:hypothetical protein